MACSCGPMGANFGRKSSTRAPGGAGTAQGSNSKGASSCSRPCPEKIVRVLAAAGQQVTAGQGLLVIEAMKMQNEIRSPKSGIVEKLAREGQTVNAGEVLAIVT